MKVTWTTYEDHLCRLAAADVTDAAGMFIPTLLVFDGDDVELMLRARMTPERDGRDPISELATYVAARRPHRVALAIPGRLRELTGWPQTEEFVRAVVSTSATFRDGRYEHRARILHGQRHPAGGERADVEVEMSPVASLLDDALRFPADVDPRSTIAVLMAWGHLAAVPASRLDPSTDDGVTPPSGRDRHRVHRLAVELSRRHTPTAPATDLRRRPAIVTDIPSGWQAACPL